MIKRLLLLLLLIPALAFADNSTVTNTSSIKWTDNVTANETYAELDATLKSQYDGYAANLSNDNLSDNTTTNLAEGTNLYYTTARTRGDVNATDPITKDVNGNFGFNSTLKSSYDTAVGWGNHASAGYALQSNLSLYFTKTEGNSTYFQLKDSISGNNITNLTWTKIDNIPSYTTSDQATNTTSDVVFANVNATTLKGDGGNITGLPAGGNASYSTLGGSTADNLTVVVSAGLIKDSGVAKASLASISTVVGLSNLTNYLNITQSNSTYFNHTAGVPWGNLTSVPANTTSDQATNTTSEVVFAKVTVNGNLTGNLQSQIKTIGFVGLNTTTNTTLWETNKNLTLTRVSASVVKGTNMTFMLYACNDTGYNGCIPCNGTAGWNAVNQTQLVITDLPNATVGTGNYTRLLVSAITGPIDGSINIYYNEVP